MLPDEVLLVIFYFCLDGDIPVEERQDAWQLLVHVCQRWRSVIFESPHYLELELVCTARTPARDLLDVWPAFPLIISCISPEKVDNIIAVLGHTDRVSLINLTDIRSSDWEILLAAMQQPFPLLSFLRLWPTDEMPVVPDSFLGGSASRMRTISLDHVPFPGLPKLLLSTTRLHTLFLWSIPHSGYFSPEAMVTALSTLTSLELLEIEFLSHRSFPDPASRRPPPSTRSVIPVLTYFSFKGVSEYLEELVARIDTPQLNRLFITFLNDVVFDTPQLIHFINRTPKSRALEKAHITFQDHAASLIFLSQTSGYWELCVSILGKRLDWQVSSLRQVCTSCLPPLSMLEDLYIYKPPRWRLDWKDRTENRLWLELLDSFTAVKNLYLSKEFTSHIAPALQELIQGRPMEVLPTLQCIFLEGLESSGPAQEGIGQFAAARQATGHPIAISGWINSEQDKFEGG